MSENRRFVRVTSRLRCWCEGENVTVYARIGNLSEGGLFLRTSTPLAAGAVATIRIGTESVFETHARVVWARGDGEDGPPGMGLEFQGVDERRREALRRLIASEQQHHEANPR